MKATDHLIVGLHVHQRARHAGEVQALLSEFGRHIRARLGLHDTPGRGTDNGLILVELRADAATQRRFLGRAKRLQGIDVQTMQFRHT